MHLVSAMQRGVDVSCHTVDVFHPTLAVSAHFFLKRFSERYPKVQEVSNKGIEWQYNQYVAVDDDASTNFSGNGDYFSYYRDCVGLARLLGDRATFVFYERLLVDFEGEIRRLARSLNVPLPPAKVRPISDWIRGCM